MSEFTGKCVLVTGSSAGIGMGIAIMFARRGANVSVCGRDDTRLQQVAETCRKAAQDAGHNVNVITVSGDITTAEVRTKTLQQTLEVFGRLDVLVANHGLHAPSADLASTTEEGFDLQFDTTVRSRLFLIKEAVLYLEKTNGCIITTSSVYSTLAGKGQIAYHMSMAAVDHMVRCLALELGPKGEKPMI
ncbi:glucose 1-dehydrogenase [Elysia marginata]|uniref:Glucose 1-dehydrogenase n=1 Tax=Elysia marginata TaxID=1093978 RepID=A0AAV4JFH4_9GAST|nr:glucose 1-dehydrogenase [Elysia marginata]